jgi:hypothetical protein
MTPTSWPRSSCSASSSSSGHTRAVAARRARPPRLLVAGHAAPSSVLR